MRALIGLFGNSPFKPLIAHMDKVKQAVLLLPEIIQSSASKDEKRTAELAKEISKFEHEADLIKNDLRNHMTSTLFMAIDKSRLLEMLSLQDSIADRAEDIAVVLTLKQIPFPSGFMNLYIPYLHKNIETFLLTVQAIHQINDLIESSFGGKEAERVSIMINEIGKMEDEVDILQRELVKKLIASESEMTYTTFYLIEQILKATSNLSNTSEKLANRLRMTLDIS